MADPAVTAPPRVELYGTASCPYTADMREDLTWRRVAFVEYDVEADDEARARLRVLTREAAVVPVLVIDGRVAETGWHGRACRVG